MKKERIVCLVLFLLIFIVGIIAQEGDDVVSDSVVGDNVQDVVEDAGDIQDQDVVGDVTQEDANVPGDLEDVQDEGVDVENVEENVFEELKDEHGEVELRSAGITPDSAFYFIDEFFDRFGNEIENREEKIAEIKAMVEAGNFEAAREALELYKEYAEKLESEADPEERDEARRSAAAIYNAVQEIENEIPEGEIEIVDEIIERETGIVTAVEISSKIKELCVQLAELDPLEYSKVCKVEDDAPKWRKKLHRELTEEQKKEAEEFGEIIEECFETSGRECRCEDISFYDFSVFCEKASSLAAECDEGEEDSCRELDEAMTDMPELPDYLMDVFRDIERRYGEAQYEMHMPEPCIRERATPKECMLIMVRYHSPPECREALERAIEEGRVRGERDARAICERIMMPPECAGLTPDECGRRMMPPECIKKGIGPEECRRFMDSMRGEFGPPERFGPPPGANCMEIQDPMERLACFEGAIGGVGERYGVGPEFERPQGELTWQCRENRIHWPPDCERFMREEWPEIERRKREEREIERKIEERDYYDYEFRSERPEFSGEFPPDYVPPEDYIPPEDFVPPEEYVPPENIPPEDYIPPEDFVPPEESVPPEYIPPEDATPYTPDEEAIPGPDEGGPSEPEPAPEPASEPAPEPSSEPAPITGEVIFDSDFFDYWFR